MPRSGQGTTVRRSTAPDTRARLSREQVAAAALELADDEGIDALTMRRLADALGVGTMTLYGYFANKRELLHAVLDAAVADRTGAPQPEEGWRGQLAGLVRLARRNMLRHPALVEIRVREPVLQPEALRFAEQALRALTGAGFPAREAAQAFRLLFTYCFGFATFSPAHAMEQDRAAARAAIVALPPADYPALTGAAAEAAEAMGGEEAFDYGLERILDGLEARLGDQAGSGSAR